RQPGQRLNRALLPRARSRIMHGSHHAPPDFLMSEFFHKLPEFIGNHIWLSLLFLILLLGLSAGEVMRLGRKYKTLNPGALSLLLNREDALVVDLSSYADYAKAHIPGARHVAMSQFDPENK